MVVYVPAIIAVNAVAVSVAVFPPFPCLGLNFLDSFLFLIFRLLWFVLLVVLVVAAIVATVVDSVLVYTSLPCEVLILACNDWFPSACEAP